MTPTGGFSSKSGGIMSQVVNGGEILSNCVLLDISMNGNKDFYSFKKRFKIS